MPTINALNEFPTGGSSKTTNKIIGLLSGNGKPDYSFNFTLDSYNKYMFDADSYRQCVFKTTYEISCNNRKRDQLCYVLLPVDANGEKILDPKYFFDEYTTTTHKHDTGVHPRTYTVQISNYINNLNKNFIIKLTYNGIELYMSYDKQCNAIVSVSPTQTPSIANGVYYRYRSNGRYYLTKKNTGGIPSYCAYPSYNDITVSHHKLQTGTTEMEINSHHTYGFDCDGYVISSKSDIKSISDLTLGYVQIPIAMEYQSFEYDYPVGEQSTRRIDTRDVIIRLISIPINNPFKNGELTIEEYFVDYHMTFDKYSAYGNILSQCNSFIVEKPIELKFDIIEY